MFKTLLLTLMLFNSHSLRADELDDFLEDSISQEDLSELDSNNFQVVDQLSEQQKKFTAPVIRPIKNKPRQKPWSPIPFIALIKKDSLIKRVSDDKLMTIKREMYIKAREKFAGSTTSYLLDKNGKFLYETATVNLNDVSQDFKLLPSENFNIVYGPKTSYHSTNKKLFLENDFTYHFEYSTSSYYKNIYRGTSSSSSGARIEIKTFIHSQLPIHFGMAFNYGFGTWVDETIGQVAYQNFFIGPAVKYNFSKKFSTNLAVLQSLKHTTRKDPDSHSYSSTAWQLDFDYETDGHWLFGIGYKFMQSSVESSTEYLQRETIRGSTQSMGFFAGYRADWIL